MTDVTRILSAIEQGDPQAAEQLLPLVYDELRKLAAQKLAQEKPGQTLQATALVHEAYLRLVGRGQSPALGRPGPLLRRRGRGHAPHPGRAAPAASGREKHGGDLRRVDLDDVDLAGRGAARGPAGPGRGPRRSSPPSDPAKAELVKLRYFAGLSIEEAARALGISPATAERHWALRPRLALPRRSADGEPADAAEFFPCPVSHLGPFLALSVDGRIEPCGEVRDGSSTARHRDDLLRRPGDRRRPASGPPTSTGPAAATPSCGAQVEALLRGPRAGGQLPRVPAVAPTRCGRCSPLRPRAPAPSSAPTSCWSRSARGAWAPSTWPSRPARCAARWR